MINGNSRLGYILSCDICGKEIEVKYFDDALKFKRENGWTNDYWQDICPECQEVVEQMSRPEKLDTWFYMAVKEMRRNSYMDLIESWDISEKEANEVENYIEEKLDVRL